MINLIEVSQELEKILNGTTPDIPHPSDRPPFDFLVKTEGVALDSITNKKVGTNFIPVYVGSMSGSINPIPDLQEMNVAIPITIYFPVRFKEQFFNLGEYLADVFVGKVRDYGEHSGRCISNISPTEYGEIQNLDLTAFKSWVEKCYAKPINITDVYMTMNFTLYLTGCGNKEISYGNDVIVSLSSTFYRPLPHKHTEIVSFVETAIGATCGTASEQILGMLTSKSLPSNAAYSVPLEIYYKDRPFFDDILDKFLNDKIMEIEVDVKIEIPLVNRTLEYSKTCFMSNLSMNIRKGKPITLSFTLADKKEL